MLCMNESLSKCPTHPVASPLLHMPNQANLISTQPISLYAAYSEVTNEAGQPEPTYYLV